MLCMNCSTLCCTECIEFDHFQHNLKSFKNIDKFQCPTHDQPIIKYCLLCSCVICKLCEKTVHNHINNEINITQFPWIPKKKSKSIELELNEIDEFNNNFNNKENNDNDIVNNQTNVNNETENNQRSNSPLPKIKLLNIENITLIKHNSYINLNKIEENERDEIEILERKQYNRENKEFLKKKSDKGNSMAQCLLGSSYFYGLNGYSVNLEKSIKYLLKSAEQNNPKACFELFKLYKQKKDNNKSKKYLLKSTEFVYEDAIILLGDYYYNGSSNIYDNDDDNDNDDDCDDNKQLIICQDYLKAFNLFRIGASLNVDSNSLTKLGICFYYGRGVSIDYNEAYRLFYQSSICDHHQEHNPEITFYYLGLCFFFGRGISKNQCKGFEFFMKSASLNHYSPALESVGRCFLKGEGISQNFMQAKLYFTTAKSQGSNQDRNIQDVNRIIELNKLIKKSPNNQIEIEKIINENYSFNLEQSCLQYINHQKSPQQKKYQIENVSKSLKCKKQDSLIDTMVETIDNI
ncbi:hypothetical protein RB653_002695 [Dictyostelium firmibasis]|uniref:Uncharacterized protein n=1 Tax=Dictyostelium firmibasis TaxID=79012 RepID=A0AAN7YVU1_9MYCE